MCHKAEPNDVLVSKGWSGAMWLICTQAVMGRYQRSLTLAVMHYRVVSAVSPPVWSSSMTFSPPMPGQHAELGRNVFMGCAVKCVFPVCTAFWAVPLPYSATAVRAA